MLGILRQRVLATLTGHPLFSDAEHLLANHFVHACENIARLGRWEKSVQAEIARRAATARVEAARLRRHHALCCTLRQVHPASFRGRCLCRPMPAWPASFPDPSGADRLAGTFDRLAAARFQPADSLTFAALLSCQSR
ncbi:MAG: hypothetical protein ACRYG7_11460 [Janthinobacterium lividum]